MASSNIKLFDENKGNMLTDTEFNISSQRLNGLQMGVASSQLQNKAMYQASLVAYAIAQVMMQNGKNANDTDTVSAFVANLSGTMLQKVYDIATTAEAQAGVATGKWMSPALVKAAIDALAAKAQNVLSDTTKTLYGLDSSAVPNDVFVKIKQKFSECVNPNLLDNWYFGNPIDQRGGYVVPPGTTYYYTGGGTAAGTTAAYYTVKSVDTQGNATFSIDGTDYWCIGKGVRGYAAGTGVPIYTVDRWNIEAFCSAVIESDGLIVNFYNTGYNLSQPVDASVFNAIKGRTVTLSAIVDGVLSSAMVVMPNATPAERTELLLEYRGNLRFRIVLNPTGVIEVIFSSTGVQTNKFKAIKLELGDQQTLANQENGNLVLNEIPNYWEELLRCVQSTADASDTFANKTVLHTGNAQSLGFPKIAIGSYTGTGTYGSGNPNTINFGVVPKLVLVMSTTETRFTTGDTTGYANYGIFDPNIAKMGAVHGDIIVSFSGTTLSWYANVSGNYYPEIQQLNKSGVVYKWYVLY